LSILALVLVGLATSFVASAIVPANEPRALLMTMAIGIAGAVLGAFLCVALGISPEPSGLYPQTTVVAALGALALIVVYRRLTDSVHFRL
jgi:uncharacterized membrane protein YeaQ/YmgE (transglycosylase-associated protein family)